MPVAQQLDGWVGPHALTEHELRSWLLGTRLGITLLITEKLATDQDSPVVWICTFTLKAIK